MVDWEVLGKSNKFVKGVFSQYVLTLETLTYFAQRQWISKNDEEDKRI